MSEKDNHNEPLKHLSPELIKAYVTGSLSEKERNRVERYLLDHPFEAEAIDGYEAVPTAIGDISMLEERIDDRISAKKKVRIIPIWRQALPYAAVFLLLLVATLSIVYFSAENEKINPISINQPDEVELEKMDIVLPNKPKRIAQFKDENQSSNMEATSKSDKDSEVIRQDQTDFDQPASMASKERKKAIALDSKVPELDKNIEEVEMEVEMAEEIHDQNEDALSIAASKLQAAPTLEKSLVGKVSGVSVQEDNQRKEESKRIVSGYVYDALTGEALPGVNVVIKQSHQGVNTDLDGYFEIEASNNDVLLIAFIGMERTEVEVGNSSNLEISLSPDVKQLSEVVVTGYATETEKKKTYQAARPEGGQRSLRAYIKREIRLPEEVQNGEISGKVKLEFTVSSSGEIKDIKVINSLSEACDKEAVRLLKNGPKWTPTKVNQEPEDDTVKLSIKFKKD